MFGNVYLSDARLPLLSSAIFDDDCEFLGRGSLIRAESMIKSNNDIEKKKKAIPEKNTRPF